LDEQSHQGRPRRGGHLADDAGGRLLPWVLRRAVHDEDPDAEMNIRLTLSGWHRRVASAASPQEMHDALEDGSRRMGQRLV
jgi:hypothetical protein